MMGSETFLVGVTTYNPGPEGARQVMRRLAVIGLQSVVYDNSPLAASRETVAQECRQHGVELRGGDGNVGTAGALNALLQEAADRGCEWLLYLDQDSEPGPAFAARMIELATRVDNTVALVGSRVVHRGIETVHPAAASDVERRRFLISSGTTVRVSVVRELGGYDEGLFLDLVDHEMCLRVRRAGLQVVEDQRRFIAHDIGVGARTALRGRIQVAHHPWWRRRLMWRNAIVVARRYSSDFPGESMRLLAGRALETAAAALVFRDLRFLSSAARGIWDGVRCLRDQEGGGPVSGPARRLPPPRGA